MFKKIALLFLICFVFTAQGQIQLSDVSADVSVFPKEKSAISINSNVLLAGELLQYKIYNLTVSNTTSTLSKLMYVSLRNEADSIVFNHKLKLENGLGNGDFFIPANLNTGIYQLIAYTNFSRNNKDEAYSEETIYVINPFLKSNGNSKNIENRNGNVTINTNPSISEEIPAQTSPNAISLKTDKTSYTKRQKVELMIENPQPNLGNGNYTLSVRKVDPIKVLDSTAGLTKNNFSTEKIFYLPEVRGQLISGNIEAVNGNASVANKTVALTIPGKEYIFKLAKTNSKGRFFFSVSEPYQTGNSVLQINEPNAQDYKLEVDATEFRIGNEDTNNTLFLDSNIKNWLQERSVQIQIENGYFNVKKDSLLLTNPEKSFYENLGSLYRLDDYTRFPSVSETFVEVITLAGIRKDGNTSKFIVYNEYDPEKTNKFTRIDPLVLMDGMLVQNTEEVINYNSKEIKSIRVITEPYRYGPKIYSGIIVIETKKGDFVPTITEQTMKQFEFQSPENVKRYYSPDYSNAENLKRIPDYRVQLLWEPTININSKENAYSFYTSDVLGTYEIKLEGYTNSGNFVITKEYFSIE